MGQKNKEWVIFFAIILVYTLVQFKGLTNVVPGDENVYYHMAKLVAQGQFPYHDFFYAHPPLHILILSLIIKIFGVNFVILKSASLLALLTASFFLYKVSLELFNNRLNDKNAILISSIALILFLFSFEVMFKATFSMGINFSLMLLMASFYLIFTKKYLGGGILAGAAGLTRLYTLVPILTIFLFVLFKNLENKESKDFFKMITGFLMTFGFVIAILFFLYGHDFFEPVFKYHFLKPALPNQKASVYKNVLSENWILFLAFSSSIFMRNKKKFQLFYFIIFLYILFLLFLKVPEEFYFSIAAPFMAVIGSYSIVRLVQNANHKFLRLAIMLVISLIFLWNAAADILFLEKYGFMESAPIKQIESVISKTGKNQAIFGDDSIVPLITLLTNRSVALNFIDANEMRFTTGLTNFYLFTNKLDDVDLSYIVFRQNRGIHQIAEFRQYAESRCKFEREYSDIVEGNYLIYKC